MAELDIVIPVYNEGPNIVRVVAGLRDTVETPHRILICYDFEEDDTLTALREAGMEQAVTFVRNPGRGAHQAIVAGLNAGRSPYALVYPADDHYNYRITDDLVRLARAGADVVCPSRFIRGGEMVGCPWLKAFLVRAANFTLCHLARLPTHDSSNGFRLFSRRVIDSIGIESTQGFTYSIELLVKSHRLGWPIAEFPVQWRERGANEGTSRFRVLNWCPAYLRWYFYAFATLYLGKGPQTVLRRTDPSPAA